MRILAIAVVMVAAACVGGCTTGSTPATAPGTTAPSPASTTPTTAAPSTSTTTPGTTTTLDRFTEIQMIFEDLERRRFDAIAVGDRAAFLALFADSPYRDLSLQAFDTAPRGTPPAVSVELLEVLVDAPSCLAAWTRTTVDGAAADPVTRVLTMTEGDWGITYVSGQKGDWLCDGPHPLSR